MHRSERMPHLSLIPLKLGLALGAVRRDLSLSLLAGLLEALNLLCTPSKRVANEINHLQTYGCGHA
jgi:hypothetical protein